MVGDGGCRVGYPTLETIMGKTSKAWIAQTTAGILALTDKPQVLFPPGRHVAAKMEADSKWRVAYEECYQDLKRARAEIARLKRRG